MSHAQPLPKCAFACSEKSLSIAAVEPNPSAISFANSPDGSCASGERHCQKKLWFQSWQALLNNAPGPAVPISLTSECPSSPARSEEHTSELQSLMRISYAVFCLKKKQNKHHTPKIHHTISTT